MHATGPEYFPIQALYAPPTFDGSRSLRIARI
jgi:hypothetical protein